MRAHDVGDATDFGGGSEFVNRGFLLLAAFLALPARDGKPESVL
jgi:hypothetical protein